MTNLIVSEQPTRTVVRMLLAAGWSPVRPVGSHTTWKSADGTRSITVLDGHRTISPGVHRKITKALQEDR